MTAHPALPRKSRHARFSTTVAGLILAGVAASATHPLTASAAIAPPLCRDSASLEEDSYLTCTLEAGEILAFSLVGGRGGAGGQGGAGGDGGSGRSAEETLTPGAPGGLGGAGGAGGDGYVVWASYTNTTDGPVDISFMAGWDGTEGAAGAAGFDGTNAIEVPGSGISGTNGSAGQPGTRGTGSTVSVDNVTVMEALGGLGGGGGAGGGGGEGGQPDPTYTPAPGDPGVAGVAGGPLGGDAYSAVDPLPAGFTLIDHGLVPAVGPARVELQVLAPTPPVTIPPVTTPPVTIPPVTVPPTTTPVTTPPAPQDPVFNDLSARVGRITRFTPVAESMGRNLTLQSNTTAVCRIVGDQVVFMRPGTCRVDALENGAVIRSFTTTVRPSSEAGAATPNINTSRVFFAGYSAKLDAKAKRTLRGMADQLKTADVVVVSGHAADAGARKHTVAERLASERAKTVARYLRTLGVKVTVDTSYGKKQPGSSKLAQNRRVEISWMMPVPTDAP